jgi:cephalosporin-C deacetylase-like acetyl esterase
MFLPGLFCRSADIEPLRVPIPTGHSAQSTWDAAELFKTPATYPVVDDNLQPDAEIRPVFYAGEPYRGQPTRVFAWIGLPAQRPAGKLPGIVLVHGGGGTAFRSWTKLWVDRGYAVIAMDTCGAMPATATPNSPVKKGHEFSGPPGYGGFATVDDSVHDQWMYHAVAAVVRGHSLLRSLPEVDPGKVGITGISWGGILTNIVAGVDSRFQFAAPVYGCGFLGEDSYWHEHEMQDMGSAKALKWLTLWDPSQYVCYARVPMLFCDGTNDKHFRLDSWQKTYRESRGPYTLSLKIRMKHGHAPAGDPPEITVFADAILRGGVPLPRFLQSGRDERRVWARYEAAVPIKEARLCYTTDHTAWVDRSWQTAPATLHETEKSVDATLPAGATAYYLDLIDARSCNVSTPHEVLP